MSQQPAPRTSHAHNFVEDSIAAEAGTNFSGVLCGRATWQDGVPVYATKGEGALEEWLLDRGVTNVKALNAVLAKGAKPWWDFYGGKGNIEVVDQVVRILQADREPNHLLAHARGGERLGAHLLMRRAGGVAYERVRTAERRGHPDEAETLFATLRSRVAAGDLEGVAREVRNQLMVNSSATDYTPLDWLYAYGK